jgi:hypothetical protein
MVRGRLHVRFCIGIAVGFRVQIDAKDGLQFNFKPIFLDICWQAVVIGFWKIIKTLNPLYENRARNHTAIGTQNRTSPLGARLCTCVRICVWIAVRFRARFVHKQNRYPIIWQPLQCSVYTYQQNNSLKASSRIPLSANHSPNRFANSYANLHV